MCVCLPERGEWKEGERERAAVELGLSVGRGKDD